MLLWCLLTIQRTSHLKPHSPIHIALYSVHTGSTQTPLDISAAVAGAQTADLPD